jgi:cellulose synthase/poly-beta-1,6-N-acetylglucosamine synthase-like glycosyltransferase
MMTMLVILPWLLAAAVIWPSLVFAIECLLASSRPRPLSLSQCQPRVAVLIPAHNEESGIADTVTALRAQLSEEDRLVVVADNCTDTTAQRARAAGAEVIERDDCARHGKGYALAFGAAHLAARPPEVVVIVDADCRISDSGIAQLADLAQRTGRPVQAEYVLTLPARHDTHAAISGLAFLVRNVVRPRGLHRLGLPCQLTGSGMALPWPLFRDAPPLHGNLVEDLVLGIELALAGRPPLLCSTVSVSSDQPQSRHAHLGQRRRWEHGHLYVLLSHGRRMLWTGLIERRADVLAMAFDLLVPPLALLVLSIFASTLFSTAAALEGISYWPLTMSTTAGLLVLLGTWIGWWRFGRKLMPLRTLAAVPLYVLWKVPLYTSFFLHGRHPRWERTTRAAEQPLSTNPIAAPAHELSDPGPSNTV